MKRKLGLLLSLPPSDRKSPVVVGLAEEAVRAGHEVYLYLIDEGVKNMASREYDNLAQSGVNIFVCAYGCQQHHVPTDHFNPRVSLCGLVVLSGLIDACDPFLSFT